MLKIGIFKVQRLILSFLLLFISSVAFGITITKVTCEMLENPMGITVKNPRFGWQLRSQRQDDKQTFYQVVVFHESYKGKGEAQALWNSGKIRSGQSQFVMYKGATLESGKRYYWKVRVWDTKGKPSGWSDFAFWEMAPDLSNQNIKWIGAITKEDSKLPEGRNFHSPELKKKENSYRWNSVEPLAKRSILLRKPFTIKKKILKATISISGLGHYELTLNGKKVSTSEFAPLWSDYDKTVYYNLYEVNTMLANGDNVIGVWLGNGMYNVSGNRYFKFLVSFGPPTLFFNLSIDYEDGSHENIVSDASWKFSESPITFNCIFGGEDYDATLEQRGWDAPEFNDSHWNPVVIQQAPKGLLKPQLVAPVKIMNSYNIKTVKEPKPGTYVLDMGQNLSGFPTIRVQGNRGQMIKLVVGESLNNEGLVSQKRSGGPYYFQYTLKGEGIEQWQPRFSYYGYQYIQIEGIDMNVSSGTGEKPVLLEITSNFIYNSSSEVGTFECSNTIFNQAHVLINNAVKSNWQSVFTDCPHREKLGWLEETHLNGPGLFYNYDLTHYFSKVMHDMADSQRPDGLVPNIAPEYVVFGGDFTDSPEWGVAAVVIPWMYYEFYGDKSLIEMHYPVMKKYVDYLTSKSDNFIVSHGLGDWYDYGDHPAGYSKNSPIALSATAHYYFASTLVEKAANLLANTNDASKYNQLSLQIRDAYNKKFFNAETKQYGAGSQYCNAVSLFLDIVNPSDKQAVLDNLIKDIRNRGNRLTTGDVGNRYLYQALARNGYNDVMYAMHNHDDVPGYGFQIKFGLTTLTEQWDPRKGNSWNHFMMGQIEEWFYRSLAGIVPDLDHPGFQHFFIHPVTAGDLNYVNASHQTLYGNIKVNWKKEEETFTLSLTVPVNTTADVILPIPLTAKILLNKKPVKKELIKTEGDNPRIALRSGTYMFHVQL